MKRLALLVFWTAAECAAATLTFEQALDLAAGRTPPAQPPSFAALRRARLPSVRLEAAGNASRTLDFFSEGPFEVRYTTSVLAVDYPLWDGGALDARIDAAEARMRRTAESAGLDDARFAQLLDAFGSLYLAQRQQEIVRPQLEHLTAEADRTAQLLASGEITHLAAADRREAALAYASQLLELEARRVEAAARLRLLTGVEEEPTVTIDFAESALPAHSAAVRDDLVDATTIALEESAARLREVTASTGFRAILSGFAGFGAAQSRFREEASEGSFGVYGLRIHVSYPLLRGAGELSVAEARADLERARTARDAALDAARARQAELRMRESTAGQRLELLRRSVTISREREESMARLIAAGLRTEGDLGRAVIDRIRREADLAAVEVERWKAARLLARMSGAADRP